MNFLIIGYGSIGREYLKILKNIKYNLIYIVDIKFKKKLSSNKIIFLSPSDFNLLNININYVFICSPSFNHFNQAYYFLKKKIPVLIEKPFALKTSDAIKLIKISKQNKIRCWVCFQNRLNSSILFANKTLKKNVIGDIQFIHANLVWSRDKKYYDNGWRGNYKTDGGVLSNQAIHLIDMLQYLFGQIYKFKGSLFFNKKKLKAEDMASIIFITKNNIPIFFNATTRADKDYGVNINVYGSKGNIKINGISLNKVYLNNKFIADSSEEFKKGFGVHHKELIYNFIYKKKDIYYLNIKDNLSTIKLINSIYNTIVKDNFFNKVNSNDSILGQL